jgi:hypothetical protein
VTDTATEVKRIPIPKNVTDREFWLDCFSSFAQILIQARLDEEASRPTGYHRQDLMEEVRVASSLADTALEEALFRQWVTAGSKRKKKKTTGSRK